MEEYVDKAHKEEDNKNILRTFTFFIFILSLLFFLFLPRSCADSPRYLENKQANAYITFDPQFGNGVLIDYRNSIYLLTVAHLCDLEVIINILANELEQYGEKAEKEINNKIIEISILANASSLCKAGMSTVNKKNYPVKILAVDFERDLMLTKIGIDEPETTTQLEENTPLPIGLPVYFIGWPFLLKQQIIEYNKLGFYIRIASLLGKAPRDYIQTSLHAVPGLSGSGVYNETNGKLVGLVGAVLDAINNDTCILPLYSIHEFLKEIPEEATTEKIYCVGDAAQCSAVSREYLSQKKIE